MNIDGLGIAMLFGVALGVVGCIFVQELLRDAGILSPSKGNITSDNNQEVL